MPSYFPEGWWETEHRNVGTGTIWSDWPGSGYSPGTEVVSGAVQLAEPEYTVLDNFEDSSSLSYDLNDSAEQTVSLSYDWSFRGDLSLLLEHDDNYTDFDTIEFSHLNYTPSDTWITSVIHADLSDGKWIAPAQIPAISSGVRHYCVFRYREQSDEIHLAFTDDSGPGSGNDSYISDSDTVDRWLSEDIVVHTRLGTANYLVTARGTTVSQLSDPVYLQGALNEYDAEWKTFGENDYGELEFGLRDANGSGAYTDYWLEGVGT